MLLNFFKSVRTVEYNSICLKKMYLHVYTTHTHTLLIPSSYVLQSCHNTELVNAEIHQQTHSQMESVNMQVDCIHLHA